MCLEVCHEVYHEMCHEMCHEVCRKVCHELGHNQQKLYLTTRTDVGTIFIYCKVCMIL